MIALCSYCRPFLPLLVILATICCLFTSTDGSVAAGRIYPRGNHWAVGHLMGKKSISSYAALQHDDREKLRDARTAESSGLVPQEGPREKMAQRAHSSALTPSTWRRGGVYKYLREITNLLHLALALQKSDST